MRATSSNALALARPPLGSPSVPSPKLSSPQFGIEILSHVVAVGPIQLERPASWDELVALSHREEVLLGCVDPETEARMKEAVDVAYRTKDTVGGVFEVVAHNVPPGLGSHITWDSRLDGTHRPGHRLHAGRQRRGCRLRAAGLRRSTDRRSRTPSITIPKRRRFTRGANRAGGLEGGITNGEDIVVRGFLKPISTLRQPARVGGPRSLTRTPPAPMSAATSAVVPAAGVIGEAMVAIVLAQAFLEKFGGDSLAETKRNFEGYIEQVKKF